MDPVPPSPVQPAAGARPNDAPHPYTAAQPAGGEFPAFAAAPDRLPNFAPPEHPGDIGRLGPYRIISRLGRGGMGLVYRAEDTNLLRPVALKVMLPEFASAPVNRARFKREAQAAAAVRSEHVVGIHQIGEEGDVLYLVMELLEGQNLDDWLRARDPVAVSAADVVLVAKGMLKGLAAIHEKGLIHRDIKPANIWLSGVRSAECGVRNEESDSAGDSALRTPHSAFEGVKLLDFGLTRNYRDPNLTGAGLVVGTPAYMAPEQADARPLDARADLFSAGVVLYLMVTGTNPLLRANLFHPFAAPESAVAEPVAAYRRVPDELARLIDRMMAARPDDRPASALDALRVVRQAEQQIRDGLFAPPPHTAAFEPAASAQRATVVRNAAERTEAFQFWDGGQWASGICRVFELDLGGGQRLEFVRAGGGQFLRGAPDDEPLADDNEKPQRVVRIGRDVLIGRYAVTQEQYRAVVGESRGSWCGDRLPVHGVSWEEARAFCEKVSALTRRTVELPTEAEWEYVCRAGTTTPFHFGAALDGTLANCDGTSPYGAATPGPSARAAVAVDRHPPNPWGVYGMHGNVWEWCRDYYGPYDRVKEQADPVQAARQSSDCRVLRGGSWASEARLCRSSARIRNSPKSRGYSYGFRVCLRLES